VAFFFVVVVFGAAEVALDVGSLAGFQMHRRFFRDLAGAEVV
jgi:hypothetical protein